MSKTTSANSHHRPGKPHAANWRKYALLALVLALVALNAIAFMQTWMMTHYSASGSRTAKPEQLTIPDKVATIMFGTNVPRPANTSTPDGLGLAYETQSIPVSGTKDESLEAWYIGSTTDTAGLILMFPGYATAREVLLEQAAAFHALGWAVLLVDFRGAGGSTGNDTTLGVREAQDISIALNYARQQWPNAKVVVYGVSMGAAAALRAIAQESADPDALILESPFDSLLNTVRNRFDAIGLPSFPSAELMVFWGSVQHGFNGFAHNPADYASSVRCPTLFLYGESDPRVTAEQSMSIFNHLTPEDGNGLVAFPGAEHESLLASDRALWVEHVARFLRDITSTR